MGVSVDALHVGKVVGVWGVKGWVKLHSYSRPRSALSQYRTWYLGDSQTTVTSIESLTKTRVANCREQGQGMVAELEHIDSREKAELLVGKQIWIAQEDLPALDEGEYYWYQLIGLSVKNSHSVLGTVSSMLETGANDVLVCKSSEAGGDDILIPYTCDRVLDIDLSAREILVDWEADY